MTDASSRLATALADRYRIERELGAGGMATVYLAHDLKHDRKVAIKVLKPELAAVIGAERFLREIKTIANLQHPHILGLIDSGEVQGTAYYVMPFVEGESLRDRLQREKHLPIADAVRIATEVATALDYAHRHGVIHRDIKPENILLHDGTALVADFGIALAVSTAGGSTRMTETGMSLGTPHYMSPEQAMGERTITARSDVYALGAITYEMLVGDPPFTGSTAQAIVAKVMTAEPASLTAQRKSVPPSVEDAVLTALEKLPADRFASAAAFAAGLNGQASPRSARPRPNAPTRSSIRPAAILGALVIGAIAFGVGRWWQSRSGPAQLSIIQRTFRDEAIFNARFGPDGQTIVYSAIQDSVPNLFIIRPDYPAPTSMDLPGTQLLSISSKGEMAVLVRAEFVRHRLFQGTLAQIPIGGGAPREILDSVREADWSPDGTQLAVIREGNGRDRMEYPLGTVLYEASGYLSDPRISPDGKFVAVAEHPWRWDNRGHTKILDRNGKTVAVSPEYSSIEGMAWRRDGAAVLFSGREESGLVIQELSRSGVTRTALAGPGNLTTQDLSPTGRLLLTRDDAPYQLYLRAPNAAHEADVSWLDASFAPLLSRDGSLLAFTNGGIDAGPYYDVMLRHTNGEHAARLGPGGAGAFSPDQKWLLAFVPSTPATVVIYPTGAGSDRKVDVGTYQSIGWVDWFPQGDSILVCGSRTGEAPRCYVHPVSGGAGRPVTPPGTGRGIISPDGKLVAAYGPSIGHRVYPVSGDSSRALPDIGFNETVIRWSADGKALIVGKVTSRSLDRVDLVTGRRTPLALLAPDRPAGRIRLAFATIADDPKVYSYVIEAYLSSLFTVDGMK
jgi:serine/threonine protein kinase